MLSKSVWSSLRRWKHCQVPVFRQEWVKCLPLLELEKMLASLVYKIRFVRLCARLTMNSELLTALCDRINHLKNWLVQLKKSQNAFGSFLMTSWEVWSLSWSNFGVFWDPLLRVLGVFCALLGGFCELQNQSWAPLEAFWARKSDLESILEWFWPKMKSKTFFQGEKRQSEMRIRFTRALKQQKLILNEPPMKITDFGISRDVQTLLRRLRKQVLTALIASCIGLVWHPANFGAMFPFPLPPLSLGFLWAGRDQEG